MPSPQNPLAVARIIAGEHEHDGALTLRHWRGAWSSWTGARWTETETNAVRAELYKRLEGCVFRDAKKELAPWLPSKTKMSNLLEALEAVTHLSEEVEPPSWIKHKAGDPEGECVACANGLLSIRTREIAPLTPRYFNTVAVPFDYEPDAPPPERWLQFLDDLWPGDPDSILALQEWFGYVLSGRTDLQKMLMLIGPTRSGKGTIARILARLVGNVAGPTLLSLGSDFGLASLLGRPLAIISDARLGRGHHVQVVVERLLSISGEDILDVNRKYREPWTGKLGTRLMLLSNELPQFSDESGAISNRFVVLSMHQSFLGKENSQLSNQLTQELPGILKWALDGLDRLAGQHSFTTPAASDDAARVMRDLVSPISAFVRETCEVAQGATATVDEVWDAWKAWADDNGVAKGTRQVLGRNLRSAVTSVRTGRPRDEDGSRTRIFEGIRLLVRNGPQWSAEQTKTITYTPAHEEGSVNGTGTTIGNIADHSGPGDLLVCDVCDEPTFDHLPGCPEVAS